MNKFQEILKQADEQRETVAQNYEAHKEKRHQETLDIVAEFAGKNKKEKAVIQSNLDDQRWMATLSKYKKYPSNYIDDSVDVHKVIKELEALKHKYTLSQMADALGLNATKYLKKQLSFKLINANFAHRLKLFLGKSILRDDYDESIHGAKHNHQVDYSEYTIPKKLNIDAAYKIDDTVNHEKINELIAESRKNMTWKKLANELNTNPHGLKVAFSRGTYTTAMTWKLKNYYGHQIITSKKENNK